MAASKQALDTRREIRAMSSRHSVTLLQGQVTGDDVQTAVTAQPYDAIHFATHSDEYHIALSNGETLDADDLVRLARLSGCRLLFFNSCRSGRLATIATGKGIAYAIATTIDVPDNMAWKMPLSFYEFLYDQEEAGLVVDIPAAYRRSANGSGTYMLLGDLQRQAEIADLMTEVQRLNRNLRRVWISVGFVLAAGVGAWLPTVYMILRLQGGQ